MEYHNINPYMPPLESGHHLVTWFFKIGPTKGDKPLDGPELESWERILGIEWTPHQALTLLEMSKAYLGELSAAVKRDAPPPWEKFAAPWGWVQKQIAERRVDAFLR